MSKSESYRRQAFVPAEFTGVEMKPWLADGVVREDPIAQFAIRNNTLGLNLRTITEFVVTCEGENFGLEPVYGENYTPNVLLMGALSLGATLEAWHDAKASE